MEPTRSFALLAARLAARADEIRPVDGAEVSWANFMALFVCAILQMLILLCEALEARAAADAGPMTAPAQREGAARPAVAARPVVGRAPRLALVPDVQALFPKRDAALSGTAGPAAIGPWLAWSRPPGPACAVADSPLRSRRETRLCVPRPSTPILLRYHNKKALAVCRQSEEAASPSSLSPRTPNNSRVVA